MILAAFNSPGAVLNGGPYQHCDRGHEPVEWRGRPDCFICGTDGIKGSISQWTARYEASFEALESR